jgi:hypothetical protein
VSGINADAPLVEVSVVPGILECFPRALEEDAVLRIHHLGLAMVDAEE